MRSSGCSANVIDMCNATEAECWEEAITFADLQRPQCLGSSLKQRVSVQIQKVQRLVAQDQGNVNSRVNRRAWWRWGCQIFYLDMTG